MKQFLFTIFLIFSITFNSFCQTNEDSLRLEVLKRNDADSSCFFQNKKDLETLNLKYLGIINKNQKILISTLIWGSSKRATNRILVFSINNKYLGNYYLDTIDQLPYKIENNKLFFKDKNSSCSSKLDIYSYKLLTINCSEIGDSFEFNPK